jgi:hypothetical protein
MGVSSLSEFRERAGNLLPRIPRNNPPQGRTEFTGLNDLLQYLVDRDREEKQSKAAAAAASESKLR